MKLVSFRLGMFVVAAALTVAFVASPDLALAATASAVKSAGGGFHDLHTFAALTLAVGLDALKGQLSGLKDKAAAKLAEMRDGLAGDVVARIETEHAAIMADIGTVQAAITAAEAAVTPVVKAWAADFFASAGTSGLALTDLNAIVAESATHEIAKDKLIAKMAAVVNANNPDPQGGRIVLGTEARTKFVTGATKAVIARASMFAGDKEGERNEFSGYTLRELARMALEMNGVKLTMIHDPIAMIGQAMQPVVMAGGLSTSDFVNILANVANKAMLKGYGEADETFSKWTSKGSLSDFKTTSRVDLGLFPNLDLVPEGAEYNYAKLTDRGITVALATYGKMFPITRQAIINDDLGAFTRVPQKMGRAAHRTVGNLVYAILTSNPSLGGTALFHASRNNLLTGGSSVLSASSLDAARAAMAKQKDKDLIAAGLNIRPKYWIGPVALEGSANQIFASQAEPGQDNPSVANRVRGMAEVIADARLDADSTTAWYLSADPLQTDTIEVSYLNGIEQPTLETRNGWDVDGVEFKVRHDAGVNLLDAVGLLKSAGA